MGTRVGFRRLSEGRAQLPGFALGAGLFVVYLGFEAGLKKETWGWADPEKKSGGAPPLPSPLSPNPATPLLDIPEGGAGVTELTPGRALQGTTRRGAGGGGRGGAGVPKREHN